MPKNFGPVRFRVLHPIPPKRTPSRCYSNEKIGSHVSQLNERERALENELVRKHEKELQQKLEIRTQEAKLREEEKRRTRILDYESDIYELLPKDWAENIATRTSQFYAEEKLEEPIFREIEMPQNKEELDNLLDRLNTKDNA